MDGGMEGWREGGMDGWMDGWIYFSPCVVRKQHANKHAYMCLMLRDEPSTFRFQPPSIDHSIALATNAKPHKSESGVSQYLGKWV